MTNTDPKEETGVYRLSKQTYPCIHITPDCTIIDDGEIKELYPQNITVELRSASGKYIKCLNIEKLVQAWLDENPTYFKYDHRN